MRPDELEEAVDSMCDFFAGGDARLPAADFVSRTRGLVDLVVNRQREMGICSGRGKQGGSIVEETVYHRSQRNSDTIHPLVQAS